MPRYHGRVKLYREKKPLFAKYQLEEQLETVYSHKVHLKQGGSIVIDQTEALVAIDVNSGRATREKSIEETAFKTNMEAAQEVARQLRLRDLGGLIVIDFIDMRNAKHNQEIEEDACGRRSNATRHGRRWDAFPSSGCWSCRASGSSRPFWRAITRTVRTARAAA